MKIELKLSVILLMLICFACNDDDPAHVANAPLVVGWQWGDHTWICVQNAQPMDLVQNGKGIMEAEITGNTTPNFRRYWRFENNQISLEGQPQVHVNSVVAPLVDYVSGCIENVQIPYNDGFELFVRFAETECKPTPLECYRYYYFEPFTAKTMSYSCNSINVYWYLKRGTQPPTQGAPPPPFEGPCL